MELDENEREKMEKEGNGFLSFLRGEWGERGKENSLFKKKEKKKKKNPPRKKRKKRRKSIVLEFLEEKATLFLKTAFFSSFLLFSILFNSLLNLFNSFSSSKGNFILFPKVFQPSSKFNQRLHSPTIINSFHNAPEDSLGPILIPHEYPHFMKLGLLFLVSVGFFLPITPNRLVELKEL